MTFTRLRRLLHRTPPARVAAHHPLPIVDLGPDTETWAPPTREDARAFSGSMQKMTDPYRKAGVCPPRHTHRDPTTGRYTRREQ